MVAIIPRTARIAGNLKKSICLFCVPMRIADVKIVAASY
jgi:hypothetical protein